MFSPPTSQTSDRIVFSHSYTQTSRCCGAQVSSCIPWDSPGPRGGLEEEGADPTTALSTPDTERSSSPSFLRELHPRLVSGRIPSTEAPAPARRPADTHLQGSRAGKGTAALRPSPGGEPDSSARLTTGPAASRARRPHPPPSFPHGTQHPRPPCSEPVGKARQTARYLPGRAGPSPAPAVALRGARPPPLPALRPAPP